MGRHLKSIITNMKKTPRRHTKHGQFHHVFFDVTQNIVFHTPHMGPRGGRVASTQASFWRAVRRRLFLDLFPCQRGVPCGSPLEMMWTWKFLTCDSLLLRWTLHYVDLYVPCLVWQTSIETCKCHVGHPSRREH